MDSIPNVAGITHANKQRATRAYLVPSQMPPWSDDGGDSNRGGVHKQGKTAYFDFMPIYQSVTNMATGTDKSTTKCAQIEKKYLHHCKKACMEVGGKDLPQEGIASHPQTSNKNTPRHLQKTSSPAKGNKERSWYSTNT